MRARIGMAVARNDHVWRLHDIAIDERDIVRAEEACVVILPVRLRLEQYHAERDAVRACQIAHRQHHRIRDGHALVDTILPFADCPALLQLRDERELTA